eukprot:6132705-Prymnesium_polylepis.1
MWGIEWVPRGCSRPGSMLGVGAGGARLDTQPALPATPLVLLFRVIPCNLDAVLRGNAARRGKRSREMDCITNGGVVLFNGNGA